MKINSANKSVEWKWRQPILELEKSGKLDNNVPYKFMGPV